LTERAKCEITNYRLWLERWREIFTATATFWPAPRAHLQLKGAAVALHCKASGAFRVGRALLHTVIVCHLLCTQPRFSSLKL
jgi:hypothetical protein